MSFNPKRIQVKKEHDSISTRLAHILMKFNDGERFSSEELAKEFNVSIRTIQRDINEKLSLIPICKDKDGKYYLESYVLSKLSFKDIKNFAILSGISSLYPSLDREFIIDLLNLKTNEAYLIKNSGFENIYDRQDDFKKISVAILQHNIINIIYNKKSRNIKPYKLINNNGIWYVLADDDGTLKTFTFSKISDFKWIKEKFKPNPEFTNRIQENESDWFHDKQKEVVIEIAKDGVYYFLRKNILPNKKIIEQSEDRLIVSTKISYDDEIINIVLKWIPYMKIVKPIEIKDKVGKMLEEYLKEII